jgi:hypothetical protein
MLASLKLVSACVHIVGVNARIGHFCGQACATCVLSANACVVRVCDYMCSFNGVNSCIVIFVSACVLLWCQCL